MRFKWIFKHNMYETKSKEFDITCDVIHHSGMIYIEYYSTTSNALHNLDEYYYKEDRKSTRTQKCRASKLMTALIEAGLVRKRK